MADEELGLNISLKGMDKAKKSISGFRKILNSLKDAAGKVTGAGQSDNEKSSGGGGKAPSGGGGNISGTAAGTLIGQMMSGGFRSFQQHMQGVFDPNLTTTERQVNTAKAVLSAIPVAGELASSYLTGAAQVQVGAAQGTAQRLNSVFGPAFQAFGAANPDAGLDDYQTRFGPMIDRLRSRIKDEERGREIGSQLISKGDKGLDDGVLGTLTDQAKKDAASLFGSDKVEKMLGTYGIALDNIAKNTGSMAMAFDQIKDYWGGKIKGVFR